MKTFKCILEKLRKSFEKILNHLFNLLLRNSDHFLYKLGKNFKNIGEKIWKILDRV